VIGSVLCNTKMACTCAACSTHSFCSGSVAAACPHNPRDKFGEPCLVRPKLGKIPGVGPEIHVVGARRRRGCGPGARAITMVVTQALV
jgi:hypothetical protein